MSTRERVEVYAKLPLDVLRKNRDAAVRQADMATASDLHNAIQVRTSKQHAEIENCGQLFEHVEPPSRENGNRFVTRYTGDPMTWMAAFMTNPVTCKLDNSVIAEANRRQASMEDVAKNGEPVTVRLRPGERVQVVGADGSTRETK